MRAEAGGLDDLWVIEDCFYTAGISLAAAALTATEHLTVGIGILPAVARNPAITAMELATLAGLAPGRVIAGLGHGVQSWMAQMGVRPPSPLVALEEALVGRAAAAGRGGGDIRGPDRAPRPGRPRPATGTGPARPGRRARSACRWRWPGPPRMGSCWPSCDAPAHAVTAAIAQAGSPQPFEVVVYTATHIAADGGRPARPTPRSWRAAVAGRAARPVAAAPYHGGLADAWWPGTVRHGGAGRRGRRRHLDRPVRRR